MELTYNELRKRDVINIADGRCLGRIIDLKLGFPDGILLGISVPGRKSRGLFRCFDKSELYIDVKKIVKIGGDVILVNLRCSDACLPSSKVGNNVQPYPPPKPQCPPPCPPKCPQPRYSGEQTLDLSSLAGEDGRIDFEDY